MNTMKYKDYIARIEFDDVDRIFVGHLAGIKDIVEFHGTTVDELENSFHEAVDSYLAISAECVGWVERSVTHHVVIATLQIGVLP